ncbi:hypothetical protein ACMFMG_002379 [Clarireedia jacksonii]
MPYLSFLTLLSQKGDKASGSIRPSIQVCSRNRYITISLINTFEPPDCFKRRPNLYSSRQHLSCLKGTEKKDPSGQPISRSVCEAFVIGQEATKMTTPKGATARISCKFCPLTFPTWEQYHQHKISTPDHRCCDICSVDFETDESLRHHRSMIHPSEQDLQCLGCGQKFVRLGSLVGHLELETCPAISKSQRMDQAARKRQRNEVNAKFSARLKIFDESVGLKSRISIMDADDVACNYPVGRQIQNDRGPMVQETGGWNATLPDEILNEETRRLDQLGVKDTPPSSPAKLEDDLISFSKDDITKGMSKNTWSAPKKGKTSTGKVENVQYEYPENGFPRRIAPSMKENDFPSLPTQEFKDAGFNVPNIMDEPIADMSLGSIWDTKHLFPWAVRADVPFSSSQAGDSVAPHGKGTQTRMRQLINPLPDKVWAPYDPSDPSFRAERYWVTFTKKYKCPHKLCKKSYDTEGGFISHLRSATHSSKKLTCSNCYRIFHTWTALTQHCESQGVRCKIRDNDNYAAEVAKITSGIGDIDGVHADNTVRYRVNPDEFPRGVNLESFARNHKQKEEEIAKEKENYWVNRNKEMEW